MLAMKKVIIVDASVTPSGSYTHLLLDRFLQTYKKQNSSVEFIDWNLMNYQ
nr:unknown [Mycoplasmoides genitalium]